jgi:hypothetical protein
VYVANSPAMYVDVSGMRKGFYTTGKKERVVTDELCFNYWPGDADGCTTDDPTPKPKKPKPFSVGSWKSGSDAEIESAVRQLIKASVKAGRASQKSAGEQQNIVTTAKGWLGVMNSARSCLSGAGKATDCTGAVTAGASRLVNVPGGFLAFAPVIQFTIGFDMAILGESLRSLDPAVKAAESTSPEGTAIASAQYISMEDGRTGQVLTSNAGSLKFINPNGGSRLQVDARDGF